jgi:hypothetical protein
MVAQLSPEERARYDALDGEVKTAVLTGRLNPYLVPAGIRHSIGLEEWKKAHVDIQRAITENDLGDLRSTAEYLTAINRIAVSNGARTVFAVIPMYSSVDENGPKCLQRLGWTGELFVYLTPDYFGRLMSQLEAWTGVPCLDRTMEMRGYQKLGLYFPLDCHFTAAGHKVYADLLTPAIRQYAGGR